MDTSMDWGTAVVVDPRRLQGLEDHNVGLARSRGLLRCAVFVALTAWVVTAGIAYRQANELASVTSDLETLRVNAERTGTALAALAHSQDNILAATERAPSVGTQSWGRRFTVTKYLDRDPAYGKDNDGFTSTMAKADPKARIVAVDPKLVPYHSWVWIEGLGWYRAEDCGSAIKGFRLDVMTGNQKDAMEFGKQDRFVIVVPPEEG
jgi:3D (Asp-Asp-Asp) domain-containing protein